MPPPTTRPRAFFTLLALLCLGRSATASDQSYQKVVQGFSQLRQGNDQAALELFQAATVLDPADGQAWLFVGTAFNQLGKPAEALASLNKGADLGCRDPELLFQTGRAELGLGDWPAAMKALQSFEAVKPGRGQTSEFLGRAYLATGEYTKADAAFQEALRRDPSLRSTVLPYQAELARIRNDQKSALQTLDDLRWFAPNSATARALGDEMAGRGLTSIDDLDDNSPLKLSASIFAGYNSNVRGIEAVAVQGNVNAKESVFDETSFGGSYTWSHLTPTPSAQQPDQLTVAGSVILDDYPQATQGDFVSSLASLEYRRPLVGPLSASLQLSGGYDALSWQGFRDRIAGRAAVQWRVNDRLLLDAGYTGAYDYYLYDRIQVQNPDALSHTFSLDSYITLSKTGTPADQKVAVRIGGFFVVNRAQGADFDYHGGGVVAGLDAPLIEHVRGQLLYTWSDDRYLNLNSLTIDPSDPLQLPTYRRIDYCNSVSVRFNRQMREWDRHLSVFAGYDYSVNSSNIPAYKFSQHVVSLGLNWDI